MQINIHSHVRSMPEETRATPVLLYMFLKLQEPYTVCSEAA